MRRRGNCYDNAPIESFRGALKNELVHHQRFATREPARLAISEYIEIFYNRQRTQARLNYQSPVALTQRFYLNRIAAQPVGLHEFRPTSGGSMSVLESHQTSIHWLSAFINSLHRRVNPQPRPGRPASAPSMKRYK